MYIYKIVKYHILGFYKIFFHLHKLDYYDYLDLREYPYTVPLQHVYDSASFIFWFLCVCVFLCFFLYREGYQYSNVSKIYQKNLKTFVYYSI